MKAVIMAGGAGSRLRPITIERPKPMITIVNKPVLGHILSLLKNKGITEVIITVQYLASYIQDYFGDGSSMGMTLTYFAEENPMGTAGSVKNVQSMLDDTFLVLSGDAIIDFDLDEIIAFHRKKEALATITLHSVANPLAYGVIITNEDGYVTQLLEKPSWGEVISDTVNTGLYVLEPEVLDFIPNDRPFDFSLELFPKLLALDKPIAGYVSEDYWCDIGNVSSFQEGVSDVLSGKVRGIDLGETIGDQIWVGGEVSIDPSAVLEGPIFLGNAVKIRANVVIKGPTVIRDNTVIEEYAEINRSIIWRNCFIGKGVALQGAIVLRHCSIKAQAVVYEGAVIGDGSIIGEAAVIHPGVKIWSGKEIDSSAIIKNSVIWGSQGRRALFGRYGVSGMVNVDFTPEFSARLGAAFGATLPKNSLVTFNRDPHRSPRMLKRAAIAGLPSAGVRVADLGVQPTPVARYFTRKSDAVAGMHVRLSPFDQMVVNMHFLDENGLNIGRETERNIERVFFREDFRRVYMEEIGTIDYATRVVETYTDDFLKAVNVKAIQARNFNIVVDYASATTSAILPALLSQLKCDVVALNANIDESKMSISYGNFQKALKRLRIISRSLKADLGVRIDVGGEAISVVDNEGRNLTGIDLSAVMAELVFHANRDGTIAITVDMPHIFEVIAAKYNGRVIRTKADIRTLMKVALFNNVAMATDCKGNFIFPEFQPGVDGLMAIAKMLEMLAIQDRKLNDIVNQLPPYFIKRTRVPCLWEAKGTVMRRLNQQFHNDLLNAVEGVRINLGRGDSILILPSDDQPHIEIIAEAGNETRTDEIIKEYRQLIQDLHPDT